MNKFLMTILLVFIPSLGFTAPYVSPSDCEAIAGEFFTVATLRDQRVPASELLKQVEGESIAHKFYTYWVKTIYGSKADPESIAMSFYVGCMAARGDIAQLMGQEV